MIQILIRDGVFPEELISIVYKTEKMVYWSDIYDYGPTMFGHYIMEDVLKNKTTFIVPNEKNINVITIFFMFGIPLSKLLDEDAIKTTRSWKGNKQYPVKIGKYKKGSPYVSIKKDNLYIDTVVHIYREGNDECIEHLWAGNKLLNFTTCMEYLEIPTKFIEYMEFCIKKIFNTSLININGDKYCKLDTFNGEDLIPLMVPTLSTSVPTLSTSVPTLSTSAPTLSTSAPTLSAPTSSAPTLSTDKLLVDNSSQVSNFNCLIC